jgi:hypothetical protein
MMDCVLTGKTLALIGADEWLETARRAAATRPTRRAPKPALSMEEIDRLFDVDLSTGIVRWRSSSRSGWEGRLAGSIMQSRKYGYYYRISVGGKGNRRFCLVHHIVWAKAHGYWPPFDLDHQNRNGLDNRIVNLRPADPTEGMINRGRQRNNKSGCKWVHWDWRQSMWMGQVRAYKVIHSKRFPMIEEAYAWAFHTAWERQGPEFMDHGSGDSFPCHSWMVL